MLVKVHDHMIMHHDCVVLPSRYVVKLDGELFHIALHGH